MVLFKSESPMGPGRFITFLGRVPSTSSYKLPLFFFFFNYKVKLRVNSLFNCLPFELKAILGDLKG